MVHRLLVMVLHVHTEAAHRRGRRRATGPPLRAADPHTIGRRTRLRMRLWLWTRSRVRLPDRCRTWLGLRSLPEARWPFSIHFDTAGMPRTTRPGVSGPRRREGTLPIGSFALRASAEVISGNTPGSASRTNAGTAVRAIAGAAAAEVAARAVSSGVGAAGAPGRGRRGRRVAAERRRRQADPDAGSVDGRRLRRPLRRRLPTRMEHDIGHTHRGRLSSKGACFQKTRGFLTPVVEVQNTAVRRPGLQTPMVLPHDQLEAVVLSPLVSCGPITQL